MHECGLGFDSDIQRLIEQGSSLAVFRAWASLFGFGPMPGGADPIHLEYKLLGVSPGSQDYLNLIATNQADYKWMQLMFAELKKVNPAWGTIEGHRILVNDWGFGSCVENPWRCALSEAFLMTGTVNVVDSYRGN